MSYSLQKEHPTHFEISHPTEGVFKVAKKPLDEKTMKKIRGLPKGYADGTLDEPDGTVTDTNQDPSTMPGYVPDDRTSANASGSVVPVIMPGSEITDNNTGKVLSFKTIDPTTGQATRVNNVQANEAGETTYDQFTKAKEEETGGKGNPNITPVSMETSAQAAPQPDYEANANKAFDKQATAIKEQAGAAQALAAESAKQYQAYTENVKNAAAKRDEQLATNQAEHDQILQSIKDQKIDPNRVWHNAGTGGTILAAIGVALAGVGSGISGGPNLAVQVIDKTIDRDIDAQRAELGKKQTLLSENLRKYGNINEAYQATSMQLHSVVQAQIAAATAKAQGSQAKANGDMMMAQLDQNRAMLGYKMAEQKFGQALGSGQLAGASGINLEHPVLKEYKDRIVQIPGKGIVLAKGPKERETAQEALKNVAEMDKAIDNGIGFIKRQGWTMPGSDADAYGKSLESSIKLSIGKLHDLNRINDREFEEYTKMADGIGSLRTDKALAKMAALKQKVKDTAQTTLDSYTEGGYRWDGGMHTAPVKGGLGKSTLTSGSK